MNLLSPSQALANSSSYTVHWPIRHGQVENWDHMERYWQQCIFKCVLVFRILPIDTAGSPLPQPTRPRFPARLSTSDACMRATSRPFP